MRVVGHKKIEERDLVRKSDQIFLCVFIVFSPSQDDFGNIYIP